MNILLLHNNNIPADFRLSFETDGNIFRSMVVNYPPYERRDFDTFLCASLSEEFLKTKYDLIILPYTLGEENYPEYSGLRLAAHVRLTKEWNHFTVPILFIGGDDIYDVMYFSDLGDMLTSFRIFTSTARTKEELSRKIDSINCESINLTYNEWLEDSRFQMFLNRIHVESPANYATHHSVANKWAVLRWIEMFSWDGDAPKFEDEGFKNMLYFKYLMAKAGQREPFKKKDHKRNPEITYIYDDNSNDKKINEIKRKRIIYIDDEEVMWSKVLSPIFQKSKVEFIPYPFDKRNQISKNELIQNIESFLKQDYDDNGGADCYLIDLRLHDDDFAENLRSEDLSGQQIAKFIKKKTKIEKGEKIGLNEGCQIVVFTASNKSWNIEESIEKIGACGYVVKESPEMNYTREESYSKFFDFSQKIKKAFSLSYLKRMYKTLDVFEQQLNEKDIITPLYECADLLNYDNGKESNIIIKSCITCLTRFFEDLIIERYKFAILCKNVIGNREVRTLNKNVKIIESFNQKIKFKTRDENGHKNVIDVVCSDNELSKKDIDEGWSYPNESPFSIIVVALLVYYKINLEDVKKYVNLRYERNTSASHGNKETSITVEDLQEQFEKVIVPILKKESEN